MTKQGFLAIVLLVIVFLTIVVFGIFAGSEFNGNPILGVFYGLLINSTIAIASILFRPIRNWLEQFAEIHLSLRLKTCKILIYGQYRSGKTSLIKRMLTVDAPSPEKTTITFQVYDEEVRVGLDNPRRFGVSVADYTGQDPAQLLIHMPKNFFGPPNNRLINAIFFVVDLFPEVRDDRGVPLQDREIVERFKFDTKRHISERVKENSDYINAPAINLTFAAACTPSKNNLLAVRLIINKLDLLREAICRNYIPDVSTDNMYDYARNAYSEIEALIRDACARNEISSFSVQIVSAKTGENVNSIYGDLLRTFSERVR